MTSSQDIVDAIHYRQYISNQNRLLLSKSLLKALMRRMWHFMNCFNSKELKPIQTIAFVLRESYAEDLGIDVSKTETLAIKNVESFFNYKTVGKNFDLVSTVLSSQDSKFYPVQTFSKLYCYITDSTFFFDIINFLSLLPKDAFIPSKENTEKVTSDTQIEAYTIQPETFGTLEKKNLRIKFGLDLISRNAEKAAEFIANGEVVIPQISKPSTTIEKPLYCKDNGNFFIKIVDHVLVNNFFSLSSKKRLSRKLFRAL